MKKIKFSSLISIALVGVFTLASNSISFCQELETPFEKNYNVGKVVEINQMGKKMVETSDFDKHIKITDKEVTISEDNKIIQRYKVKKKEVISGNTVLTTVLDERSIFKVWIYKCDCLVRIKNSSWEFKYKVLE
ncbi:MAG: hypothetical protein H6587_11960 [Flavobacteriales bacterium]|nr:hypothetical protein [Flavobacteriales bacterium]MCB9365278.1 hypothetical protein [Flavobacteriales bacterium]